MQNSKGEEFKLAIRYGSKTTDYSLYDMKGNKILRTRSISEII